ncbi:alpha/beta hydrolase [Leptolyngbya cf. ectocarpi LEGE 11479]|uniref:Alpha/beta hydrolase n=1 Tax=Leptolyngbya cf. ectocarpi LEGE 11479 TaxID=1828722 RepID=A0A929F7K3_LEPEC|nr:alpha/beta hydrolase [Leptolyngbya ectocarpi]MBE9068795.1 alpha/beta hydrolase [Leptolyngbya cf. ectocarpi LEGE 11479]
MKDDIFAKMTEDTRALVQQMQANASPSPNADFVLSARDGYRQIISLAGSVEEVETIEHYQVTTATPAIPVRLYRPRRPQSEGASPLPALVYFHGGGFISGDFDTHDRPLRALANASGCVIVAVKYRLAPEFPFPAAPDDCFAALQWVIQQAKELRIDASKVAVGGDSAGGLLATVVCLMCRDRNLSQPIAQILIYPNTDLAIDTASWHELDFLHPAQSRENFLSQVAMYVPEPHQRGQPYTSPLRAPDLSGLAPALMITAELDAQCDEGEAYAQRLRAASCLVTHTHYPGVLHGFFQMGGVIASGRVAITEIASYLRLHCRYGRSAV